MSTVERDVIPIDSIETYDVSCEENSDHAAHQRSSARTPGLITGTLIGFKDEGQTPLVIFAGQRGAAAVAAASITDVHGAHIGCRVALMFEDGDPQRPVILGILQIAPRPPVAPQAGLVTVEADGTRLIVSAREQLVLRCGKASITLTKAGKVLIRGAYLSSFSTGVNRIAGGSIHLN